MQENDVVLCTVERIVGTSVFVNIDGDGEGSIVMSEIAPGRIRNIRDYVVPGKKIVCKILRTGDSGNIHLSLRRVTSKEKNEVIDKFQKEKEFISIIKAILKDKANEVIAKIKKEFNLYEFYLSCKENPAKLEKYFNKETSQQICKILQERKEKKVEVKKEFLLSSSASDGILIIKKILSKYEGINYLAAGKFTIKIKADEYKKANSEMQKILQEIEKNAKKEKAEFFVKEK